MTPASAWSPVVFRTAEASQRRGAPLRRGSVGHAAGASAFGGAAAELSDPLTAEVMFCRECVVRAAAELEVVDARRPLAGVRDSMVELEPGALMATLASRVRVSTSAFVTLPHGAPYVCGRRAPPCRCGATFVRPIHCARRPLRREARLGGFRSFRARTLRGAVLLRAQSLHQRLQRPTLHFHQIAIGHHVRRELARLLEQVEVGLIGRELNAISCADVLGFLQRFSP